MRRWRGRSTQSPTQAGKTVVVPTDLALLVDNAPDPLDRLFVLAPPRMSVGRDPRADVNFKRDDVSYRHAELVKDDDGDWWVHDLESTNGTYVDQVRVKKARLIDGTVIQFAKAVATVVSRASPIFRRAREEVAALLTDRTTRLPNRKVFDRELELALLDRDGPAAVMFIQLDQLETVNNQVGRSAGDDLIRAAARTLERFDLEWVLCRYDASFALLVEATDDEARELASRLQGALARLKPPGLDIPVTATIGIATAAPGIQLRAQRFIDYARSAQLDAARLGGNQVLIDRIDPSIGHGFAGATVNEPLRPVRPEPLLTFERRLREGMRLFAVCIEERRLLEATHPVAVLRLDRLLAEAVHRASVEAEADAQDSTAPVDVDDLSAPVEVGQLPSGDVLLLALKPVINLDSVVATLESRFEALRDAQDLPAAQLMWGPPVKVADPKAAVRDAVAALQRHQKRAAGEHQLPQPIAWATRMATPQPEPLREFFLLRDLHQAIVRWLFSVLAAELLQVGGDVGALSLREILARPVSEGTWVQLLRRTATALADIEGGGDLATSELLRGIFPKGQRSEVLNTLDEFTAARNKFAHGQEHLARRFCKDLRPRLEAMLAGPLDSLKHLRPREVIGLRYSRETFKIRYRDYVGDHLVIAPQTVVSHRPAEQGQLLLVNIDRSLHVVLEPFVISARCPQCELEELFFLDRLTDAGPEYVNLREGRHRIDSLDGIGRRSEEIETLQSLLDRL